MRYHLLGHSGLRVSELCLGAMTFGEEIAWGASQDASRSIYHEFRAAGGNFIDTADFYTGGASERMVGEFIKEERDAIVLATKYTDAAPGLDPNAGGNSRKNMMQSIEASLRRLNTDVIDLYWVHAWDFMTPEAEVMRGLDDLVRSGKVRYVGISDAPAWIVSRCNTLAELRGRTSFIGLQVQYNLIDRTVERELLPMAAALDVGVLAWSPLGSGLLSGKYAHGAPKEGASQRVGAGLVALNERNLAIAAAVAEIAEQIGCSSAQVALNWLRAKGVIPILGATKAAQIADNLACLDHSLSSAQIERLDAASAIELGFPHDFLVATRGYTYGGMFDAIHRHRDRGIGATSAGSTKV
jgi:aryl-alcohol dehydrogenase-like predicted oxidoreductase